MTESDLIKKVIREEESAGCYNVKINGITAYTLLRQLFRQKLLVEAGLEAMQLKGTLRKSSLLPLFKSSLISFWHVLKLVLGKNRIPIVFLSFPRMEKINNIYVEKFTDPLIDVAGITTPYVIFETGRMGVHLRPRIHSEKVINVDIIRVITTVLSVLGARRFNQKHKEEFATLMSSLRSLSKDTVCEKIIVKQFLVRYYEIKIYEYLFRRLKTKFLLGPTRPAETFIAGHRAGALVCELQHGITYGETVLYSGYRDPIMIPDYFLAYGDNKPSDVYGMDEERIINIGWALQNYIASIHPEMQSSNESVLVISDPEITETLFQVIIRLANDNPKVTFEIRPHPHEIIPEKCLASISNLQNVKIQDNKINITEALMSFNMVIGENSTVLYEALAVNKKVGRLFYDGLNPKYLVADDKESFWEIRNQTDFESFLKEDVSSKKSKCIYSPFNRNKFAEIINCNA